jgi:hypothetical protein
MPTVVIGNNTGDDYAGILDNRLDDWTPNYNNGGQPIGYCGIKTYGGRELRELQRWDLSDIPSGATCDAAVLSLYDTNWVSRTSDNTINIYEIADANGDWIEGTARDKVQNGSPCWDYKAYNSGAWAGSAGLSTSGTDYINTSLGSAIFTDGVSGYRTITLNADGRSVVAGWFGEATNNGVILRGSGTGGWTEWVSRSGTDGQRPYLTVTYTVSGSTGNSYYYQQQQM